MRARYYISFNGVDYLEFFPSNIPKITPSRESGEIFFRYNVDEFKISSTKNQSIYLTLESYFFDNTKFSPDINYRIKENGATTFEFKSSINNGIIDIQNGIYRISPKPDDDYYSIMQNYDTKYRVIIGGISINYPTLLTSLFANVDYDSFDDNGHIVTYSANVSQTAFNTMGSTVSANQRVTVIISAFTGDTAYGFYISLTDNGFVNKSNTILVVANGIYQLTATGSATRVLLKSSALLATSGQFTYSLNYTSATVTGSTFQSHINKYLGINYMNTGLTCKSTYLFQDALPTNAPSSISTFISSYPNGNYAGNDNIFQSFNPFYRICIARVDNWTTSTNPSTDISLKNIMSWINIKLRAYWFIDDDGYFRIEHEEYFRSNTSQLDITGLTIYKPEIDRTVFESSKGDVYSKINYQENNQSNEDFVPFPVLYEVGETTDNALSLSIECSSDITYIYNNPSSASNSGIIFLACTLVGSTYYINFAYSILSPDTAYLNLYFSWAYLFKYFWTYFQEAKSIDVNDGTSLTALGVKEFITQTDINFYYSEPLDWLKPVTLEKGTAWLQKWSYTPETGYYSIDVGYDPYKL